MHAEKQIILDNYAQSIGYDNFIEIISDYVCLRNSANILENVFTACDLVQQEQQKRIKDKLPKDGKSLLYCAGVKDTILNPENLIK